ncbi:penicillin-binding protein 2 [Desulfohalobiaceae bacterium Ax17]|jgi:penicillin-binding protein 2|uniref:penicillin-binding protein 2 n=1 Tax=Desulfovulcanus ferrireducens TaxID=2831190 RepID=UPI00207BCED5|nr:penicillin-binding protein 2 [Desulfovulcanus ferrireducens]MBT8763292.1 penicillin-binding protein 2 [Desulfovulcanus ferrireducens]
MSLFNSKKKWERDYGPYLILVLIWGLFCVFGLRLWYLQIYKGEFFAQKAKDNRLRKQSIYAPRGLIMDRKGKLLAINEPSYSLAIVREDCPEIDKTLLQVSKWTGVPFDELKANFERGRRRVKSFEPQIIIPNLSFEVLAKIEAYAPRWPGLKIMVRPRRKYLQGPVFAHVLGYVAQASEEELNKDSELALGDNIGKQGLEYVLEKRLRGKKGLKRMEVDAVGRSLHEEVLRPPQPGEDIHLSLDLELQKKVYELMEGRAGAVVVMEPDSGQILSLVSSPSYDNNKFVQGVSIEDWRKLIKNPLHPLQNRCIQSVYPPGSVFKLVVAACGLFEKKIDLEEKIYCSGAYRLGRRVFRCWKKHGHGRVDFTRSLVESCDVYYYKLGEELGVDRISSFAKKCGFGQLTGIDLPHEKRGLIPDRNWKLKRFKEPWQGGETLNMSIGQGYTLVTPLQVARFVSALVNGGKLYKPSLLSEESRAKAKALPFADDIRQKIIRAMIRTVEADHGTARGLRKDGIIIGAKTGTAQVVKLLSEYEEKEIEEIPYRFRDHAWMASFAKKGDRSYVVVAMVEHGGHGGSAAGPIVRAIFDFIFEQ